MNQVKEVRKGYFWAPWIAFFLSLGLRWDFFWPLDRFNRDFLVYHLPYLKAIQRAYSETLLPMWLEEISCGVPALSDISILPLHPLNYLLLFLSASLVLKIQIGFHLSLLYWGLYKLIRRSIPNRNYVSLLALLGTMLFTVRGILEFGHLGILGALSFLPWVILFLHLYLKHNKVINQYFFFLSLCVGALWYVGHSQLVFIVYEAAFIYAFWYLVLKRKNWKSVKWIGLILICLSSLLIGCGQLLPALEYIPFTGRSESRQDIVFQQSGSVGWVELLKWMDPWIFGSPRDYIGPNHFWFAQIFGSFCFVFIAFVGVFRLNRSLLLLCLLFLSLCLGGINPLYLLHQELVPGANLFRYPSRYLFALIPFFILCFGHGVIALLRQQLKFQYAFIVLGLNILFILFHLRLLPLSALQDINPSGNGWFWIYIINILVLFGLCFKDYRKRKAAIALLCIFFLTHDFFMPFGGVRVKEKSNDNDRGFRSLRYQWGPYMRNEALATGEKHIGGYCALIPRPYREFLDTQTPQDWTKKNRMQISDLKPSTIDFFNIRERDGEKIENQPIHEHRVSSFYLTHDFYWPLEKNNSSYSEKIIEYQTRLKNDFEHGMKLTNESVQGISTIELKEKSRERKVFEIKTNKPIVLASSASLAPFWKAKLNGKGIEVKAWMKCFKAVFLPEGHHKLEFYIEKRDKIWAIGFSAFLFFLFLILGVIATRRPLSNY